MTMSDNMSKNFASKKFMALNIYIKVLQHTEEKIVKLLEKTPGDSATDETRKMILKASLEVKY